MYFFNNRFQQLNAVVALPPNYDGDASSPHVPYFHDIFAHNIEAGQGKYGIRI